MTASLECTAFDHLVPARVHNIYHLVPVAVLELTGTTFRGRVEQHGE
jgi:hypothetical protein